LPLATIISLEDHGGCHLIAKPVWAIASDVEA